MTTQNNTTPKTTGTALNVAIEILRTFYDLHPQDPLVMAFNTALSNDNSAEIAKTTDQIFTRFPTNPIRANLLYKRLNATAPDVAAKILDCYQSGQYANQIAQGLEDKVASIEAQMELDEAEINVIRQKIVTNLEPEHKACEERIAKLQDQIEQQREVVESIQDKVDAVATRLTATKKNLQDAIYEQTRLDKEISALSLEDDDEDDESKSGSGDSGRLKKQKSGQERIAELIKEEIAHLDINQKAVTRELDNAKAQLATLEDMLASEVTIRDDIAAEIEAHKARIAGIEAQSEANGQEIAKLEADREFVQSAAFQETFNALAADIPMPDGQEEKLTKFIEDNAKSDTLLSAADEAHVEFLSEQEKQNLQNNDQTTTIQTETTAEETADTAATQEEDLTLDRDLAMEAATDHAIRIIMTMEAGGMVPEADFDSLMDALPPDLRNKVEPAVEERLIQKGITIDKNNGFTLVSDAKPQIFDPKSQGPRSDIDPANPAARRGTELRQAFADSEAFKKYNAEGIEASYDTKPIKGIDPNIFQKGLNNTNFGPAQENQGPALDGAKPEQKQKPAPSAEIKLSQPGQGM